MYIELPDFSWSCPLEVLPVGSVVSTCSNTSLCGKYRLSWNLEIERVVLAITDTLACPAGDEIVVARSFASLFTTLSPVLPTTTIVFGFNQSVRVVYMK
jgi:hypothetical protein